jgi:hypothetical protein
VKYVPPYGITANPDASYINGDPSIGRQGSIPPAAVFENPQREIVNLIADAQQVPADTDLHQTTRAVRDGKLNFCIDSGPLNSLQVQLPGPPLQAYTAGVTLNVLVAHTNTGPTHISVGTLNPTTVKRRDGAELMPSDLLAGMVATLVCDGTYFQLINMGVGAGAGGDTTVYSIDIPYVHDTGIANHLIGLYSPPLPNINEGRTVEIKLANAVTGPTDFKPNNFPIHPIAHPDGSPIQAGDGVVNQIWLLIFDGTVWQLISGYFTTAAPTVPAEPIIPSGRSLEFHIRGMDQSSHLRYRPAINGNRSIWTYSEFCQRTTFANGYASMWGSGEDREFWGLTAGIPTTTFGVGGFTGLEVQTYLNNNAPTLSVWWNNNSTGYLGVNPANWAQGYCINIPRDLDWHHMLMCADGAFIYMYWDGVLVSKGTCPGGPGCIMSAIDHEIGYESGMVGGLHFAGANVRIAESYGIDGLCLSWDKFAQQVGGLFVPKPYTGAFGQNGWHLDFKDGSLATSTTLGKDVSGNNNNWTPGNITTNDISTSYPGRTP